MLRARDSEKSALAEVIEAARAGHGGSLVLRGEAGVGKTALLSCAAELASGFHIAGAAGAEFEMELPFAGLHALCTPFIADVDKLPAPQQQALETAFGLASGEPPDALRAGQALLSLLSDRSADRPLLCLLDDAQWLDRSSAQAIAFATRRLESEPVAFLFATRESPFELRSLPELQVEGLPEPEALALLESLVPTPIDQEIVRRIVAEARGNPLVLTEMANAASGDRSGGGFATLGDLVQPGDELFRGRLEGLPAGTRKLLLLAAAEPLGDPLLLWRAAELLGLGTADADPACDDGTLEIDSRVRFYHPLVRSAAYRMSTPAERREAHQALATATDSDDDEDRYAWHLSLAAAAADEALAALLERSADRARRRGGMVAAAALLARASELSEDPEKRWDRVIGAAEMLLAAGDPAAALELLPAPESLDADGLRAARAERLRGRVAFANRRGSDAPEPLRRAARALERLDPLAARDAHLETLFAEVMAGALGTGSAGAAEVARSAPPPPRPPRAADLLLEGMVLSLEGEHVAAAARIREAWAAPEEATSILPPILAFCCFQTWDLPTWESIGTRQAERARADGALIPLVQALGPLTGAQTLRGEVEAAERLHGEAQALVEALFAAPQWSQLMLSALRGDVAATEGLIERERAAARSRGEGVFEHFAGFNVALLHNGHGEYATALEAVRPTLAEPPFAVGGWCLRELVEAASRCEEEELAGRALVALRARTDPAGTDWARGVGAVCGALLADGAEAESLYVEAIEQLRAGKMPLELARAHLLYGEWLRRERRKLDAREQLKAAHEQFLAIGAQAFAERAARELGATGEHARRRDLETADELTPQELQIVKLVKTGATSKEVAAELFISPRTVDAHLRNIFRKLDITSRRQLRSIDLDLLAPLR